MDKLNFETFDFDSCIEMAKLAEQAERFDDMKEVGWYDVWEHNGSVC